MSNLIDKKIMIPFPKVNSPLEKILVQESVNVNYEYPFSSAVNDAPTLEYL